MEMSQDLCEKYDIPGPRYTSYPPLPFWDRAPTEQEWWEHWQKAIAIHGAELAVYIHIPFCKKICLYCGLNREECDDEHTIDLYLQSVVKEWQIYQQNLGPLKMIGPHLGGGTPTALNYQQLKFLLKETLKHQGQLGIGASVEADPRTTDSEKLKIFYGHGFRRISFGVQDLNPDIQEIIGRQQSFELLADVYQQARDTGFQEINFDLIYGLPGQNLSHIENTFGLVNKLRPETVAFYSFAYVPHFAANQKNLDKYPLAQGAEKRKLYQAGRELLCSHGYQEIGLDHFGLPTSSLVRAMEEKKLYRSFMGYTEQRAPLLAGLGTSSISTTTLSYIQNQKQIKDYVKSIDSGKLAILKGHILTDQDLQVANIIQNIMCRGESEINFIPQGLQQMVDDQLVTLSEGKIQVLEKGKPFLRNISMLFDHHLLKQASGSTQFSRTI
ncbi:MAG: oxygen-independent coproporphyrinogen III oxidase [Pseudomonadota bacterium]